jgi:hypothetical protein
MVTNTLSYTFPQASNMSRSSSHSSASYQNIHLPFSWYEHLQFCNAVISTLYEPILPTHLLRTLTYLQFLRTKNFNLFDNSPVVLRTLLWRKFPEDDLKKIKTYRSFGEMYVKLYF